MTEPPLLSVVDLEAGYSGSRVLFGVSLNVARGEVVTLLGRNGMGKTTTILSIMGILASRRGKIIFDGTTLTGLPSFRVARHGVGLVPERRQIFPNLTVQENLVATAATRKRKKRNGPSGASSIYFRCCASVSTVPAICCREASSRCWQLVAP